MEILGIKKTAAKIDGGIPGTCLRYSADMQDGECLSCNTVPEGVVFDSFTLDDLLKTAAAGEEARTAFSRKEDLCIQPGGWQSWSAGWELGPGESLPGKVYVIPELIKLTNRQGDDPGPDETAGHFIAYIRSGDWYLGIASKEGDGLAPVTYRINRKEARITAEIFAPGKTLNPGEILAELNVFLVRGYFMFKDSVGAIYRQETVFKGIDFLRSGKPVPGRRYGWTKESLPGGYESWYNHYNRIDEKIITEDLAALDKTDNLINLWYIRRKKPAVFQIDDGWEITVGEWEIDTQRFPRGLKPIAEEIERAGRIPGLWLAPFLVTKRSRNFREKPEWLLRDHAGEPVVAGFNHLWDKQYYCLDISREDVLEYLKQLIDRAIDEWGFRYLKLDFLYTGLFYGNFSRDGAPHEHYRRACEVLTGRTKTAAGLPVAYLGCGLPFGLSYRFFPLSRIGADTREMWDWKGAKLIGHVGRPSAYISLLDTIGRSFMDGTVYISDPDVVFLRSRNCKLKEHEKECIALVNFLLAGQIMFSDDPVHLEPGDIALTRSIAELYDALAGDDYGAVRLEKDVFRLLSRSGTTAGLINLGDRAFTLGKSRNPDFFSAMETGTALVDHRTKIRQNMVAFAPHTITIIRN
ncbi:glycoside hydrolase family 36 protein [Breznakiella homolactica]|uniref:Alpha-galactosidase n=1 Tax=Breznakiella homolactica TaxID=2798577 RepID=A0A7T7XN10_9SPIR|nr:glycoside hydrolase family 36 protein [Breznakiella homolactica]QQO09238.1 alpha-galactosidase [Breznakiella homolactica]